MVEKGEYPSSMDRLAETLERVHNIIGEPSEDRAAWVQALSEPPKDRFEREKDWRLIWIHASIALLVLTYV